MVAVCSGLLAACSSSSGPAGGSATPLSRQDLQRLYLQAAVAYDQAESPVVQAENRYCPSTTAAGDLNKCETALSQDRQATITFDNAIRQLAFPASARADVNKLLSDDSQLETLLEQAATSPSLSAITTLSPQIYTLLATTNQDANRVRTDIGLPQASAAASPSASTSAPPA